MAKLSPYTLKQAQKLVKDAEVRAQGRRRRHAMLNGLYRYGRVETFLADNPGMTPDMLTGALGLDIDAINLILPHVNILVASCTSRDPRFVVTPWGGDPETEDTAVAAHALLSHFWAKSEATEAIRTATKDMVLLGNGFVKVTWHTLLEQVDRDADEVEGEFAALVDEDALASVAEDRDPTPMDELRSLIDTTESVVSADQPVVEYVNPDHIIVPPNARRMHQTRWIAQRLVLPLDELLANPAYENKDTIRPTSVQDASVSDLNPQSPSDDYVTVGGEEALQWAVVYEFYDMRTRELLVWIDGAPEPLYDGPVPYAHRYPPFVHIRNYDDGGDEFWAFGDAEAVTTLQRYLNEAFTEQMENLRRGGNVYIANRNLVDEDLVDEIQTAEPEQVILADLPTDTPLDNVIRPLARQPLPADVYNAQSTIQAAMGSVMGLSSLQQGDVGTSHVSATAVASVEGQSSLRIQDKTASVERACERVAQIMLGLIQEFLAEDTAIRVAGSEGVAWVNISAEDIHGDFRVTVETGSTKAVNPATKANAGRELLQLIPTIQQALMDPRLIPIVRSALRDMGYDPDTLLAAAADPEQAPQTPGPEEKILESLKYSDAPLDVRRQIEEKAGFQPSQIEPGAELLQQAGPEGMPAEAGMPPEMAGMGQQMPAGMDEMPGASEASLNLGGPPVDAATEGDLFL